MKNSSSLKSKPETPKTPGGISKSLLTPCRRVGLSRNWRKSVASPFNSPLASSEAKQDNVETRKRKEHLEEISQNTENDCDKSENVGTPSRKVDLPRRKKSKTLLNSITKTTEEQSEKEKFVEESVLKGIMTENVEEVPKIVSTPARQNTKNKSKVNATMLVPVDKSEDFQSVSIPVHSNCKSKNTLHKILSMPSDAEETLINTMGIANEGIDVEKENLVQSNKLNKNQPMENNITSTEKENADDVVMYVDDGSKNKKKSPNNLTKECVVVIQNKIFKKQLKENEVTVKYENSKHNSVSQALFNDSDSDDVPLNNLITETKNDIETVTIDDDDDFETTKPKHKKMISKTSNKNKTNSKAKTVPKENTKTTINDQVPSQNSIEDDDFFEKRTILIRKTYDKVIKPSKAKSTGSITQKDIDNLKARIETKKKMLVAKSMTDTKELRELIKKWQKGCQDALMELMDLMKNKCSDQNMEYSTLLQSLKIPAALVGYDSDNDCFVTPDDENIILSHIKE